MKREPTATEILILKREAEKPITFWQIIKMIIKRFFS